jgi:hypothetical protein
MSPFLSLRISKNLRILESGSKCSDSDKLKDKVDFIDESAREDIDLEDLD